MGFRQQIASLAGLAVAMATGCLGSAKADVIETTPTLPLLGEAYASSGTAGCFTISAACVVPGTLSLTSQVLNTFGASEDILSDAVLSGEITTLSGTPISPFSLTGTVGQDVIGRTSATATGTWTVDLTGLTLTGSALGDTLTVSLDGSHTSSGTTSIVASGGNFAVNSFFDVFVDIGLSSVPPQTADGGAIVLDAVPEPISLLILTPACLALLAVRRRGL